MLGDLPTEPRCDTTHRYTRSPTDDSDFLAREGFDIESAREILEILVGQREQTSLIQLLDGPFKRKRSGRYSDGSFPVFYSALEPETAQREAFYWYGELAIGDGTKPRTWYYDHLQCRFAGLIKDLRGKKDEWPLMISSDRETAYPFCNRLGVEAVAEDLHGLYAPSARRDGGTCMPVFRRSALSDPMIVELSAFSYHPGAGVTISARPVDE